VGRATAEYTPANMHMQSGFSAPHQDFSQKAQNPSLAFKIQNTTNNL
jgi:hypothetical protein